MKNVQVRNVSDQDHAELKKKAAIAGLSLQAYLQATLHRVARQPTVEEVLSRVENRTGGRLSLTKAAQLIRADRDSG